MHRNSLTFFARASAAALAVVAITACAATGGPDWTYAPLGPTPSAGAPTPGATIVGELIEVSTPDADPLAYDPNPLNASADTLVTVSYTNDSALEHNVNFFDGADSSAPSLGKTTLVIGPGAVEIVSFTTPETPGDYFFWCDLHTTTMTGTLHVE